MDNIGLHLHIQLPKLRNNKAAMADLVRGLNQPINAAPAVWDFLGRLPDRPAQYQIEAVYQTLCLFAIHAKGAKPTAVLDVTDPYGSNVGCVVGHMCRSPRVQIAAKRQFDRLVQAKTQPEMIRNLGRLFALLRDCPQSLDYAQLRWDIQGWRDPQLRSKICSRWVMAYVQTANPEIIDDPEEELSDAPA